MQVVDEVVELVVGGLSFALDLEGVSACEVWCGAPCHGNSIVSAYASV